MKSAKKLAQRLLRPCEIDNSSILKRFEEVPREFFVPKDYRNLAYSQASIPISQEPKRLMTEPLMLAKILSIPTLLETDNALILGGETGYCAALIAPLVKSVLNLESDSNLVKLSSRYLKQQGILNVTNKTSPDLNIPNSEENFDLILMMHPTTVLDSAIKHRLNHGGRLICQIQKGLMVQVQLYTKAQNCHQINQKRIFEYTIESPQILPQNNFKF